MKIDIQRLDERIKKLQEARRIAADPELVSILLDFVSTDAPGAGPLPVHQWLARSNFRAEEQPDEADR